MKLSPLIFISLLLFSPPLAHAQAASGGPVISFGMLGNIGMSFFGRISFWFILLLLVCLSVYMIITRKKETAQTKPEPSYKRLALITVIFMIIYVGLFVFLRDHVTGFIEFLLEPQGPLVPLWLVIVMSYVLQFNGFSFKKFNLAILSYLLLASIWPAIPLFGATVISQLIVANLAYKSSAGAFEKGKDLRGYLNYTALFCILLFLITYFGITADTYTHIGGGTYFSPSPILHFIGAPIVFGGFYDAWIIYYLIFLYIFFYKRTKAPVATIVVIHCILLFLILLLAAGAAMA